ncbi:MAG: flagellar biosynthetic protein FliO [Sedimenticola sp.]
MRWAPLIAGFWLIAHSVNGLAESKQEGAMKLAESPIDGGLFFETAMGLVLVVGLIFALAWLVRKFGHLPMQGKGMVEVLGGVSLGPRERAVVVKVGETRLLVGVAPGRVQTLHVLDDGDAGTSALESEGDFSRNLKDQMAEQKP